jgi:hypothetical protein
MKPPAGALAAALLSTLSAAAATVPPPPGGAVPYRRNELVPVTCLNRTLYVPIMRREEEMLTKQRRRTRSFPLPSPNENIFSEQAPD